MHTRFRETPYIEKRFVAEMAAGRFSFVRSGDAFWRGSAVLATERSGAGQDHDMVRAGGA